MPIFAAKPASDTHTHSPAAISPGSAWSFPNRSQMAQRVATKTRQLPHKLCSVSDSIAVSLSLSMLAGLGSFASHFFSVSNKDSSFLSFCLSERLF